MVYFVPSCLLLFFAAEFCHFECGLYMSILSIIIFDLVSMHQTAAAAVATEQHEKSFKLLINLTAVRLRQSFSI